MHFIKLQAQQLFDGYRFQDNKVLVLQQDGTVEGIVDPLMAGGDVLQVEGILSPGFINCHCHLELSHLKKQIPQNTGLSGFVRQVVQKRNFSEELIRQAVADAETEMLQNGIVAVGDICNTSHTLLQKQKNNLYYHHFIEAMGFDATVADKNFELYKKVYDRFIEHFDKSQVSITPHAPYSVSDPLWQKILYHEGNGLFSIHNQETPDENLWFEQKAGGVADMFKAMGFNADNFKATGTTSLQAYLKKFLPGQQVLLVHNVYTSINDIQYARNLPNTFYWCLCPNANYYISRTLPDVPLLMEANCDIVLGTDSLASNEQLNIWEEIKMLQQHFHQVPLEKMLQWATLNGARALKAEKTLGSFEAGKKPGMVSIVNGKISRLNVVS